MSIFNEKVLFEIETFLFGSLGIPCGFLHLNIEGACQNNWK